MPGSSRLRRFFAYPFRQKLLLVEASLRLVVMTLRLRMRPSAQVSRVLVSHEADRVPASPGQVVVPQEEICWAVRTAARYIPGANCLPQALVGAAMLQRAGHPAEIKLGVANDASGFQAHAWLCSRGEIVLGESRIEYAELPKQG